MIEVDVHQQLRALLRSSSSPSWPHQLTMARLVARAMRLGRSALMQTGCPVYEGHRYRLSYLVPLLMWPGPVIWVGPEEVLRQIQMTEIPHLQEVLEFEVLKSVARGDRWPSPQFSGILLMTPEQFLPDRLKVTSSTDRLPAGIPTIIDGVDDLEYWTRQQLNGRVQAGDWTELMLAYPQAQEQIRDTRVALTRVVFQHPPNPYECCLLAAEEEEAIAQLLQSLLSLPGSLPQSWQGFCEQLWHNPHLLWAEIHRSTGQFTLGCGPVDVAEALAAVWSAGPLVLIGETLDRAADATGYCDRMGLDDLTCVSFTPSRHQEPIHLYLPDGLPLPNTPQFQGQVLQEIQGLLGLRGPQRDLTVILVGDVPLKAQVGAALAGQFGSKVQVETLELEENGILVCGWEFWRSHQGMLPAPGLLAIAALPIPSLENPLVAGRVTYYKQQGLDWFRDYLLPTAIQTLKRAVTPVRGGVVALFDTRVLHRSYGKLVLSALEPMARINYRDRRWIRQIGH
ncbi:hypothetical protein [Roseofilum casamattae]|uniref:ATP-dependent DNA helicase n=1 Tax=Roseofilum casamattae BLCC-M143 TaxID=3022442 RepID=A0ABT7BW68_9CYAN|nr:hypothetical protein [Roseofilum casamattae]MDJ1183421.1 ATP-dependent DNA helicase [Roseofilum casamattae BLCC-M143]